MTTNLPFNLSQIKDLISRSPNFVTPFYVYDQSGIEKTNSELYKNFIQNGFGDFANYFAVKALPNPEILKVLAQNGSGFDCSSMAELLLCQKIGVSNQTLPNGLPSIIFTSNNTSAQEFAKAQELGAIINFDDLTHLEFFTNNVGKLPEMICFRYNPGKIRSFGENNFIIGQPESAKFGMTKEQLLEAYQIAKNSGTKRFGLHTMLASNELEPTAFVETAKMLLELVFEIKQKLEIEIEFINLGGGMGINYKTEQKPLDLEKVCAGIRAIYDQIVVQNNLKPVKIITENGRFITGPHGYLVTKVIHTKNTYKNYLGVDANMANLMRPGMYGAYHQITVLGKENFQNSETYDIVGSLCENNDKFAVDRLLPKIEIGDFLVIGDAGAHGHAMGFNYNGKLRSSEFILEKDGSFRQIRRKETYQDLFATLEF